MVYPRGQTRRWVHLSCAFWLPSISFDEQSNPVCSEILVARIVFFFDFSRIVFDQFSRVMEDVRSVIERLVWRFNVLGRTVNAGFMQCVPWMPIKTCWLWKVMREVQFDYWYWLHVAHVCQRNSLLSCSSLGTLSSTYGEDWFVREMRTPTKIQGKAR